MNWWPVHHQHLVLFWDIPHMTMDTNKTLAKNTDSDILCVTGKPFSMGSTVEVVMKCRNAAMVHADLDSVLSVAKFVRWDVCAVCPTK
jgi:hypothetical protein